MGVCIKIKLGLIQQTLEARFRRPGTVRCPAYAADRLGASLFTALKVGLGSTFSTPVFSILSLV